MQAIIGNQQENNGRYRTAQQSKYLGDDHWEWSVWLEGQDADLDAIRQVVYTLHYTFPQPIRVITTRNNNFRLDSSGWGTFTLYVRIQLPDDGYIDLEHELELYYPYEEVNPQEEIQLVTGKSEKFVQLTNEINALKQQISVSELPEQQASLERSLMNKISEWEMMRSNINEVMQTIQANQSNIDETKIAEARGFMERGDFLSASQALE